MPGKDTKNEQDGSAVPVDCKIEIRISEGYTEAYIVMFPPRGGGLDVTREMIDKLLEKNHIVYNLNDQVINEAVENKRYRSEFLAASALMPVEGESGTVTYTYAQNNELVPKEGLNDFVDYKELGLIRNVRQGDVLAKITFPVEGIDGIDIRGRTIKAKKVKKADYKLGRNTALTEDGTTIYASCDGNVTYGAGAFNVDPSITINGDVDASTGNIDFIGDVIIKGEVMEGYSVYAERNLIITGNVNNATVKTGGTLVMKGCINSSITAAGNINCQFCEHSRIYSNGNIIAANFLDCEVFCGGSLTSGSLGGGIYTVLCSAEVTNLGTRAYAYTELTSGNDAILIKERAELLEDMEKLDARIAECSKIIDFLNTKRRENGRLPDDKEVLLGDMVKKRLGTQMEKKQLDTQISAINDSLVGQKNVITCKGRIYPNTRIYMNAAMKMFDEEVSAVKIRTDEFDDIVTSPMY